MNKNAYTLKASRVIALPFIYYWLMLWENRPLQGWKERFTHPCVTVTILSPPFQRDVFWLPMEFLLLLVPNMHAYLNHSQSEKIVNLVKSPYFSTPKRVNFSQHTSNYGVEWIIISNYRSIEVFMQHGSLIVPTVQLHQDKYASLPHCLRLPYCEASPRSLLQS